METLHYDLVVVGGGATGLSLLLGLYPHLKRGQLKSILLIEKNTDVQPLPGRSIALNYNTLKFFKEINALPYLASKIKPIKNILVKNHGFTQSLILKANEHHLDQFGGVIDLATLQHDLTDLVRLMQSKLPEVNIEFLTGIKVNKTYLSDQVRKLELEHLELQSTLEISTDLVIIANGANFIQGLENYKDTLITHVHDQYAMIADVEYSSPLNNLAIEYFTQDGPVAFLPISDSQASVVWCTNKTLIEQAKQDNNLVIDSLNNVLTQIGEETLKQAINCKFNHDSKLKLVNLRPCQSLKSKYYISACSDMTSFTLNSQLQTKLNDVNLVYLGNAAHTLHPVSGQGFNLATLSIQSFLSVLETYQELPFATQANIIAQEYHYKHLPLATEVFNRTNFLAKEFTTKSSLGSFLPNLGLYHLINYPFLQELIVSPSLGYVKPSSQTSKLLQYLQKN
ncbi:hypothetical protein CKF54_04825 [Psittacicella hinzii]|uniref:Uncharacterized protein n=1 Tax=Psittacicella hinzii TaxID=2028575 RepID=A0A3A1Y529_9GAMM|nr:FAD-dependent monooxygenase [Psittacicella hinzii]RIY32389.1 hypothetical protein CKF54_04825 [Psittacicella hinzii]